MEDYKAQYEQALAEQERVKAAFARQLEDMAICAEARRRGTIDEDVVLKLIDRSRISTDIESDVCLGVGEAIDEIVVKHPILFPGKPTPTYKPTPLPRMIRG